MPKRSGRVHPAQPHPEGSADPRAKIFVPKPRTGVTRVGRKSSDLASRFEGARESGGGIQPGANRNRVAPIGNPIKQIAGLFKRKNKKSGR